MNFSEITTLLQENFGTEPFLKIEGEIPQPCITVASGKLTEICSFLKEHPALYFDYLACVTGIDNGTAANTMEVLYHLNSLPYQLAIVLKVVVPRNPAQVPSLVSVWKTADWHERETYDLLGIEFTNHPDLRRILLPTDWEGHPLRKDYQEQESYHGIKIKWEKES